MNLEEARQLLNEFVSSERVRLHCREVEAIMRALAGELGEDEEKWAIAGLMHDMDCDVEPNIKNQVQCKFRGYRAGFCNKGWC